jgi:putative Holliday junction resolvase
VAATSPDATVLAFDFGTRRIGVAVGNTLTRRAHPLATIAAERTDARIQAIAALITEWQPGMLVVGLPTHADGTEHDTTQRARRFARQLDARFGLPIAMVDERWTSEAAQSALAETGITGRKGKAVRDQVAAQLILQSWFDEQDDPNAVAPNAAARNP